MENKFRIDWLASQSTRWMAWHEARLQLYKWTRWWLDTTLELDFSKWQKINWKNIYIFQTFSSVSYFACERRKKKKWNCSPSSRRVFFNFYGPLRLWVAFAKQKWIFLRDFFRNIFFELISSYYYYYYYILADSRTDLVAECIVVEREGYSRSTSE